MAGFRTTMGRTLFFRGGRETSMPIRRREVAARSTFPDKPRGLRGHSLLLVTFSPAKANAVRTVTFD